jgi:phytoene dehydrogenase-like protein
MSHDAIVIGAGTNGLVAAHMLARKGRRVLVLEQQEQSTNLSDLGWVHPRIIADLQLLEHGFTVQEPDPWMVVPLADGTSLVLSRDIEQTAQAIRRLSPRDATRWPEFCARMRRLAGVLEDLYMQPAPDVDATSPGELLQMGLLGLKIRSLGGEAVIDLLRILPMPVADLLDEWFECDPLKAALGAMGVLHLRQGPRSGGTAFMLLHHCVGSPAGVFHPPATNLGWALLNAGEPGGRAATPEIRHQENVARIDVKSGRVTGVTLENGDELRAPVVISTADPQRTLLGLLEPGWLDPEFARAVGNIKSRSITARVALYTSAKVDMPAMVFAPSLDFIEHAFDAAKYNQTSEKPYFHCHAEPERIVAYVQYVPCDDGNWDERRRAAFIGEIEKQITAIVPAAAGLITRREIETPYDRMKHYKLTGGHVYQGEMTLDQILFMRPVPGWSRHRMPIDGLYLCGAGTHPGGSVAGGSGWLAAKEVLRGREAGGGRG